MAATPVADEVLLSPAELSRLARVLARFLAGRQPSLCGAQVAGRQSGQGLDFLDFRDYQAGDDLRSVDWRATARSQGMQVRRHCADLSSDWCLCIDASASMGFAGGSKWQQARRLAAATAYLLLYLGNRVSIALFTDEVDALCPPGRGHAQYARILGVLGKHQPREFGGSSDPACCAALVGIRNPLLVISDFLAPDAMVPGLGELLVQGRDMHLFQVTSERDLRLQEGDYRLLQDIESGDTVACGDMSVALRGAARRFADLQLELRNWSDRYRIPCTACAETEEWRAVLLRHFMSG